MTQRKTIQANPLDAVIPFQVPTAPPSKKAKKANNDEVSKAQSKKVRLTVHVTEELSNRVKNAVYWTPGLTLAALAEEALTKAVSQLEKKRGSTFPQRTAELKGGRPLK